MALPGCFRCVCGAPPTPLTLCFAFSVLHCAASVPGVVQIAFPPSHPPRMPPVGPGGLAAKQATGSAASGGTAAFTATAAATAAAAAAPDSFRCVALLAVTTRRV